jgi:putative protein-disulfide isomerase
MLQLRENLPENIIWQNVLGGLAADNDQAMDEQTRQMVQGHWRRIQSTISTEFNFDFWSKCTPRRDTYKACRAVIAASIQQAGEQMTEAIQRAYYLRAMNPSDPATLINLAVELGLDRSLFERDLYSTQTANEFQRQLSLRTELNVWSFPSLVLEHDSVRTFIKHDYHSYQASLEEIERFVKSTTVVR